ncbi:MAG: lipopolysaccharide heptosyltransferase II [Bacteroidales bacterium]
MDRSGTRVIVFAPNWLGDAVMAVPCLELLKRRDPAATLAVAARAHLAPLYEMVDAVDEVVALQPVSGFGGARAALADAGRLRAGRFDVAVLLPNSFRSALIARLAGIRERRGYARDGRRWLLTHAAAPPERVHMVEYYRRLVNGVGLDFADHENVSQKGDRRNQARPHLSVRADARERARALLAAHGWTPGATLVGMAPGAAYGTAKQWLPERFAQLAAELGAEGVRTVLVGTNADVEVCARIAQGGGPLNLAGRTTLAELAAVVAECGSFVTNDSGAMHIAVAVGAPVTALIGPTQEWETGPDYPRLEVRESESPNVRKSESPNVRESDGSPPSSPHAMIIGEVPCRPCMLRECPTQHECMVAITVDRVKAAVFAQLAAGKRA